MKHDTTLAMNKILIAVLLAVTAFGCSAMSAEAKEASQNFVINQTMKYFWNRWNANSSINNQAEAAVIQQSNQSGGAGWEAALASPNVTILYRANVVNDATGALVTDASNIPVGTVLRLEFEPHVSTDISWFGTGYSMDSPYGEWRTGATGPALTLQTRGTSAQGYLPTCEAKDYVTTVYPLSIPLQVYVPFVVNPPTKSITTSSNLTCDAPQANGNRRCTVTAEGPVSVAFDFAATYGKFYYRYTDTRNVDGAPSWAYGPGCYGNNVALRPSGTSYIQQTQPVCWNECTETTCVPPPNYFDYGDTGTYNGGGAGGGCFEASTPVMMADGTAKSIAKIEIGDRVRSADPITGEAGESTVTATLVHDNGSYPTLVINDSLVVTHEHEMKVTRGGVTLWRTAGSIEAGDSLIGPDGHPIVVESIVPGETLGTVYNLTTVPQHTYYADGVLVHNAKYRDNGFYAEY